MKVDRLKVNVCYFNSMKGCGHCRVIVGCRIANDHKHLIKNYRWTNIIKAQKVMGNRGVM